MRLVRKDSTLKSGSIISKFLCIFLVLVNEHIVIANSVEGKRRTSIETGTNITCNRAGSRSSLPHPVFETCMCKDKVTGAKCDTCKPGTIDLQEYHDGGCIECACSGVAKECHLEEIFLTQLRAPVDQGLNIWKMKQNEVKVQNGTKLNETANAVLYNFTGEEEFYWELPFVFNGNKIKSYGRYLSWTQNYVPVANVIPSNNPHLLIIGSEGTLMWTEETSAFSNINRTISIQMHENVLKKIVNYVAVKASRSDVMRVLSSIEYIRIRALAEPRPTTLYIANITMEVEVTDEKLIPTSSIIGSTKIEFCQCPDGYTGTSCETCEKGYFKSKAHAKDPGTCRQCPCNGREIACWLKDDYKPFCNCYLNYTGRYCEILIASPFIYEGPFNVTAKAGSTVLFDCRITNTSETYKEWLFEPSGLPSVVENNETWRTSLRKKKKYYGADERKDNYELELRDVALRDQGWYTCRIYNSMGTDIRRAYLEVYDGRLISEGPTNTTVSIGDFVRLPCVSLNNSSTYQSWIFRPTNSDNVAKKLFALTTADNKDALEINKVSREDEGWYTCHVYNKNGLQEVSAYLRVVERNDKWTLRVATTECLKYATSILSFLSVLVLIPIALLWFLNYRAKQQNVTSEEAEL